MIFKLISFISYRQTTVTDKNAEYWINQGDRRSIANHNLGRWLDIGPWKI